MTLSQFNPLTDLLKHMLETRLKIEKGSQGMLEQVPRTYKAFGCNALCVTVLRPLFARLLEF